MNRVNRREVLDCASPLALWHHSRRTKSARGLAQSKTLSRFWSSVIVVLLTLAQANAATNAAEEIGVPKLGPPYSELPPTFWERHGLTVIIFGLAGLLIAGALVWFLRRSKPVVVLPPEVRAQRALESLRPKLEDGAVLSQVSRILREYFRATFELPPDELTTTEFCHALSSHEKVGAELATQVSDFLRRGDEHKFSALPAKPLNAVVVALELVALGEARRAQLQQTATGSQTTRPAQA